MLALAFYGIPATGATKIVTLMVPGMHCSACAITIKKALDKLEGVEKVEVTYKEKKAVVTFDDAKTKVEELLTTTKNAGYPSFLKK